MSLFRNYYSFTLIALLFFHAAATYAKDSTDNGNIYKLDYVVQLLPKRKLAEVTISLQHQNHVRSVDFNLIESGCSHFKSENTLTRKAKRIIWNPNSEHAQISFRCKINHKRKGNNSKGYDAYINKNWAIFRGDDLIPPAKVTSQKNAQSAATLKFKLPKNWPSVNTGWPKLIDSTEASDANTFIIDNPLRSFDRPTGWMIAGKLGTRRSRLGDNQSPALISVSAPKGSNFRRMDILAFINIVFPEFENAFGVNTSNILILGGDDPMWRGGLSASNSFYLHSARPIISENGTSTLVHELFHMLTGIQGVTGSDWITEGLAEYYSIELMYRSGAIDLDRKQRSVEKLKNWSKSISTLSKKHSSGPTTAAAAVLFSQLDEEIKQLTKNTSNLDSLVIDLISKASRNERVSIEDLASSFQNTTGKVSETLQSSLLD